MRPGINSSGIVLESVAEQRATYTGATLLWQGSLLRFLNAVGCNRGVFAHITVDTLRAASHPSKHAMHDMIGRPKPIETDELVVPFDHAYAVLSSLKRVADMRPLTAKLYGVNPAEARYVVESFWADHNPYNESVQ